MSNPNTTEPKLIRPAEAAAILGVSTRTVYDLGEAQTLHPRKLPSGHRRYDRTEVEALAAAGDAR